MLVIHILLGMVLPFIILWWCFPWYAAVRKAVKNKTLSKVDIASFGIPFLGMAAVDILCNVLSSILFMEAPFIHGITLSGRCSYWWNQPQDKWRHGLAHAVKVQTDKFEKDHIH